MATTWLQFCKFSVDGEELYTASFDDQTIKAWDVQNMSLLHTVETHAQVLCCASSPHGKECIAFVCDDGTVGVANMHTKAIWRQQQHNSCINDCDFSPAINAVASASSDDTIKLWDATTLQVMATFVGHVCAVSTCQFCGCGGVMVTSDVTAARVWDVQTQNVRCVLPHEELTACRISCDESVVVTVSDEGTIKLWDTRAGTARNLTKQDAELSSCALSNSGTTLVTEGPDGKINSWDLRTETVSHQFQMDYQWISCLQLSPSESLLASISGFGVAKIWDVSTRSHLWTSEQHSCWKPIRGHERGKFF